MRKFVLSAFAVVLSSAWAAAQTSQPGFSYLSSKPAAPARTVVTPTVAAPPEPGSISNAMPMAVPSTPISAPSAPMGMPNIPMGVGPAMPGLMNGPVGMPIGTTANGPVPGPIVDSGYAGGFDTGYALDPPSSLGTERIWVGGRYLLGYLSRGFLSTPLVTTGDPTSSRAGAVGNPSTVVLFGEDQYQFGQLHGVQVDAGVNLNDRLYLEGVFMYFMPAHTNALFASDALGNPLIARPVINADTNVNRSYLTSLPGQIVGATSVETRTLLFSIEGHARYQVNLTPYLSVDALFGYRRMQLEEDIEIRDKLVPAGGNVTFLGNSVTAPNFVTDFDRFATTNQFNGGNAGLRFRWQSGFSWLAFQGYGKLAVGATRQTVEIEGLSAAGDQVAVGGILAQASNIGHHQRTIFGVIPEGGAGIIFLVAPGVRMHAGYSATYWNNVVRPGDHIDPRIPPGVVPTDQNFVAGATSTLPAFTWRGRAVWLQTLNFGVEFYY